MVYFSNLRKPVTKLKLPKTERTIIVRNVSLFETNKGQNSKSSKLLYHQIIVFCEVVGSIEEGKQNNNS